VVTTVTVYFDLPVYSNARIVFKAFAVDNTTNYQFGKITSAKLNSVNRNVDGFLTSYNKNTFKPITISNQSDYVIFDLGIVTNTSKLKAFFLCFNINICFGNTKGYSMLIEDNLASDNRIFFTYTLMAIPNITLSNMTVNATSLATLNFDTIPVKVFKTLLKFTVNQTLMACLSVSTKIVNSLPSYASGLV
jgi:hypothetical protein